MSNGKVRLKIYRLTVEGMTKKPVYCPNCGEPIWGEGWNPDSGSRYFSHVDPGNADYCYEAIELQGDLQRIHPVRQIVKTRRIARSGIAKESEPK